MRLRLRLLGLACLAAICGCGGDRAAERGLPPAELEDETGSSWTQVAHAPQLDAETLTRLKEAARCESEMHFEEAVAHWKVIRAKLAAELEPDHWQIASCDQAIVTDQRLAQLLPAQRASYTQFVELDREATREARLGNARRALQAVSAAQPIAEQLFGPAALVVMRLHGLAANLHLQLNELEQALRQLLRALDIAQQLFPAPHPEVERTLFQLGQVEQRLGLDVRAAEHLGQARRQARQVYAASDRAVAERAAELGAVLSRLDRREQSLAILQEMESLQRAGGSDQTGPLAQTLLSQARVLIEHGQWNDARKKLDDCLTLTGDLPAAEPQRLEAQLLLASAQVTNREFAAASALLAQALHTLEQRLGRFDPRYASTAYRLGMCLGFQARFAEAEPHLRHALAVQRSRLGPEQVETQRTVAALAQLLERTGRVQESRQLLDEFAYTAARGVPETSH